MYAIVSVPPYAASVLGVREGKAHCACWVEVIVPFSLATWQRTAASALEMLAGFEGIGHGLRTRQLPLPVQRPEQACTHPGQQEAYTPVC
eukprot:1146660-Pelagomonas_calceolata.AAC.7